MDRVVDESNYVLSILKRMREEIRLKPDLFDPDAQRRINEAITLLKHATETPIAAKSTFV